MRSILWCVCLFAPVAQAADVLVGPLQNITTIQGGIDAANQGDRVLVDPGTYNEAIYLLNRDLTVESVGGPGVTIIEFSGQPTYGDSEVVRIEAGSDTEIRGFTIDGLGARRGLYIGWYSHATLDDLVVRNGVNADSWPGGGLDLYGYATATVSDCTFENNTALNSLANWGDFGGNIAVEFGASLVITGGTSLTDGVAGRGGGLWAEWASFVTVDDTVFESNESTGSRAIQQGGGMYVEWGGVATVDNSSFLNNFTDLNGEGGGLFVQGNVVASNNTFEGNSAHKGAGMAVIGGEVLDMGSQYTLNVADVGGAVACLSTPDCTLQDPWIENNSSEEGAGLFAHDAVVDMERAVFCANKATAGMNGSGDGGAALLQLSQVTASNTVFFDNEASGDGGAVYFNDSTYNSVNNHYIYNMAYGIGGALRAQELQGINTTLTSLNDLVAWNDGQNGALVTAGQVTGDPTYAHLWSNTNGSGNVSFGGNGVSNDVLDPELAGGASITTCDLSLMYPQVNSPLVNNGDPFMTDPDGSVADIGAFGGTEASPDAWADGDGDGTVALFDCDDDDPNVILASVWWEDSDADGWGGASLGSSCTAPAGAVANGIDCDDTDDLVGGPQTWWDDDDQDGYGDPYGFPVESCTQPYGFVSNNGDCDDTDASVVPTSPWWPDLDQDGYGDASQDSVLACDAPYGYVDDNSDCDDSNHEINPETAWFPDEDYDGLGVEAGAVQACEPGDGWALEAGDCDDADDTVLGPETFFTDEDGDGYGTDIEVVACPGDDGISEVTGDCDPYNGDIFPGAEEYCDEVDQDCDGETWDAESVDASSWSVDADGDGFGDDALAEKACVGGDGLTDVVGDCDDSDETINPAANEQWYDGVDQNCDGLNDFDQDADGFDADSVQDGSPDCNDLDPTIHPEALDGFDDGVDQNCDGVDPQTWINGGGGCACDANGGSGSWGWLLMLGIAFRRLRRSA